MEPNIFDYIMRFFIVLILVLFIPFAGFGILELIGKSIRNMKAFRIICSLGLLMETILVAVLLAYTTTIISML
jgi:hypothetical protein